MTVLDVALIHSAQPANPCKAGDSERDHTRTIALACEARLIERGVSVGLAPIGRSFRDNLTWLARHPHRHGISIHTNATGRSPAPEAWGILTGWVEDGDKPMADAITQAFAGERGGAKTVDWIRVGETVTGKTVLVELHYHDHINPARYIHENAARMGRQLADAIADHLGAARPADPLSAITDLTYTVRAGDTLSAIARRSGYPVEQLIGWNMLTNPDRLTVGQVLRLTPPPATAPKPGPAPARAPLRVDGILGALTIRAMQRWVGATVDGVWGPVTTRALQRKLGVTADGTRGPTTTRALQRLVGAKPDGIWGPLTTRALQTYLNRIGA